MSLMSNNFVAWTVRIGVLPPAQFDMLTGVTIDRTMVLVPVSGWLQVSKGPLALVNHFGEGNSFKLAARILYPSSVPYFTIFCAGWFQFVS